MPVNVLYQTSARATGGRDGHSATLDGAVDVSLAIPKELGGGGGPGSIPSSCSLSAMRRAFWVQ